MKGTVSWKGPGMPERQTSMSGGPVVMWNMSVGRVGNWPCGPSATEGKQRFPTPRVSRVERGLVRLDDTRVGTI